MSLELGKAAPATRLATRVRLREILDADARLEASSFDPEARAAVASLQSSGLSLLPLFGEEGLCHRAQNGYRLKRVFVDDSHGVPFLSSSDINSLRPTPDTFLSRKLTKRLDDLLVKKWDVLISRSGTIGNIGFAGERLEGMALSEDAIRLRAEDRDTAGYVAAFLRSKHGRLQLTRAAYGSVVVHIEPHHLRRVLIPAPHPLRRIALGRLMVEACELRDEANQLLDDADRVLHQLLRLPYVAELPRPQLPIPFSRVRLSEIADRFDASYHAPLVRAIEQYLQTLPVGIAQLGDPRVSEEIRPVTKFRQRVWVQSGGIPLLSSKGIFQIDSVDKKYLGTKAHAKDLPEIALEPNMILITCSGTIGRVLIVPPYMKGWAANQHATRVVVSPDANPGYVYAWLASDWGHELITRNSYGSVILEADKDMLSAVPVPLPTTEIADSVGSPVMKACELFADAWAKEQEAISGLEALVATP